MIINFTVSKTGRMGDGDGTDGMDEIRMRLSQGLETDGRATLVQMSDRTMEKLPLM